MTSITIRPTIKAAEELYDTLNQHFFDGELPKPVITISPDKKGRALGWCSAKPVWDDSERFLNDDALSRLSQDEVDELFSRGYYEINICPEYLCRDEMEIYETLLHEMCHLYNAVHGIKDTSNNGFFHNRKYKAAAEAHGLDVFKDEKYGWSRTALSYEAQTYISEYAGGKDSPIFRKRSPKLEQDKKSSTRTFVCPGCGLKIRSTKGGNINIRHEDCGVMFVEVTK